MDDSIPRVCLLGGFSVATEDGVVEERAWRLRKAKALVKLLALAPERRLHRERLADLLWPDRDARRGGEQPPPGAARRAARDRRRRPAPQRRRGRPRGRGRRRRLRGRRRPRRAATARRRRLRARAGPPRRRAAARGPLRAVGRRAPGRAARAARRAVHRARRPLRRRRAGGRRAPARARRWIRWPSPPTARSCASTRPPGAASRRSRSTSSCASSSTPSWPPSPTPRRAACTASCSSPSRPTETRGNLPQPLTSFVGRERERAEIVRLLARVRLLTLIGPGGCGKTRLAIETLAERSSRSPTASGSSSSRASPTAALVAQATALAVGVPIPAQRSAQEALAAHLATREAIIVLDNCEHVIDACARLAEDLLRGRPRRARAGDQPRAAALRRARSPGASRRWRRRAGCSSSAPPADPRFSPNAEDEATIDEICRRLDGMPLAIELAAARVAALSLDQIAARLGDSLDVLAAGSRTARTRQQTLRATIEWSHDLLTGEERVLFRRLAVFAGGFTLEAAEDVCAGGAIARRQIVDLLARLVDKSLVSVTGRALPPARHHPPVRGRAPDRGRGARHRGRAPPRLVPGAGRASTIRCRPAPAARCARWRPSTTICARG